MIQILTKKEPECPDSMNQHESSKFGPKDASQQTLGQLQKDLEAIGISEEASEWRDR